MQKLYTSWGTAKIPQMDHGVYFMYTLGKTPSADFYQNWPLIASPGRNNPKQI
jgi:hypothetical protein